MSLAWIIALVVLAVIVLIVVARRPKKTEARSELIAFAESFNTGVFPNGKADHDEGARMVHDIVGGTMTLDECRDVFIKAAIMAGMQNDVVAHLQRRYGERLSEEQRSSIAGYLAIRILAMASGPGMVVRRQPNGVISFGPE